MTLWLPLGNFARSYAPLVHRVAALIEPRGCVQVHGLTRAQIAAFQFHGALDLHATDSSVRCEWLLVDIDARATLARAVNMSEWTLRAKLRRPSDDNEDVLLFRRLPTSP